MSKSFAWSYSSLTSWESCPKKWYETRITKSWPDEKGEAAQWGDTVHKAIEARMKFNTPLPQWGQPWEPYVVRLLGSKVAPQIEHKIAITAEFKPTAFFAPNAWCRAVADVSITSPKAIFTLDWKTGNFKSDTDQLRLSAAMQMAHFPHIEKATIQYVWLKAQRTTTETFDRSQVVEVWRDFLPRVHRMQQGFAEAKWPAKPNGLCRQYCPVLSCEHNGRRK